jgi:hypothetical protein
MLKDNEVYGGEGNAYTAEFWEYDPRIGRRWNVDPIFKDFPWQSPFAVFNDNPVSIVDKKGLKGEGWIENCGTGEKVWDPSINSQEDFDKSSYNKEGFSYAGQSHINPDGSEITIKNWTPTTSQSSAQEGYRNGIGVNIDIF